MITIEHDHPTFVVCRVSGVLARADYMAAEPELENAMGLRSGPFRVLVSLEDFRGWELDGFWEELRFDMKHHGDFDRVAVVGESAMEKWATRFTAPFFSGEVRYFDRTRRGEAEAWLGEPPAA